MNRQWFLIAPKMTILFVNEIIHRKMSLITKDDFSVEIKINFQLYHNALREYMAQSMVIRLQFLREHYFVWMKVQVHMQIVVEERHKSCDRLKIDVCGFLSTLPGMAAMFSLKRLR